MRVVSFDVGIKNLAFCDITFGETETVIHRMGIIDVSAKTVCEIIANVSRSLNDNFSGTRYAHVVIENQPSIKNPKVKTVQTSVHAWFVHTNPDQSVVLYSPKCKNQLCCAINEEEYPKNYRDAKKQSVRTSRGLLGTDFFSGKADDVSDAFLQAVHFYLKTKKDVTKEGFHKYVNINHEQTCPGTPNGPEDQ